MDHTFNVFNAMADTGMVLALASALKDNPAPPVVVCIGSDLAIGDSLGPVCGTMLCRSKPAGLFVYGTLKKTITAKEIGYMNEFLRETHPARPVIAVDAAVGDAGDIGLIRVTGNGVRPGLGTGKKMARIGDVGILGIVAEKSLFNYSLLNLTRLNLVYKMAERIAGALAAYAAKCVPLCGTFGAFPAAAGARPAVG